MRVIFLDTEFTSAGELAQLSYLIDDGERCRTKNFYFRVSEMDEGSQRVHHLTKEFLDRVQPEQRPPRAGNGLRAAAQPMGIVHDVPLCTGAEAPRRAAV